MRPFFADTAVKVQPAKRLHMCRSGLASTGLGRKCPKVCDCAFLRPESDCGAILATDMYFGKEETQCFRDILQ